MSLKTVDTAHVLLAVVVLLVTAHAGGRLFALARQPQVIGEIAGGLLLGPTVLGVLAPGAQRWLLPPTGPVATAIGVFQTIGLLLLVYLTGTELRRRGSGGERRTIGLVAVLGLVLPFGFGLAVSGLIDPAELSGPNGSPTTLTLVFGMAIAVTSVPVISRIMLDLGILGSLFARIVLAVAVIEDVLLYVMLAVILGVSQAQSSDTYGLWSLVGAGQPPRAVLYVYFAVVPLLFLALLRRWGPGLFARLSVTRLNAVAARSPVAFRLIFLFLLCAACSGLGIDPIFGALVAGMCTADAVTTQERRSQEVLRSFALGVFIPVYFAVVGVQLDLAHHFDALFFCWFLVLACVAKSLSVWLGARLAGERNSTATHLAIAMNARGGPGIVLASVTYGALVIDQGFFTSLVLLSIITSQMAGLWLGRAVARGAALTGPSPGEDRPPAAEEPPTEGERAAGRTPPERRPTTTDHPKENTP
ncbi:potassium transporter [Streptomyces sulfonofaciens]|uniref:Potassium transporter n=1 Tax=Streptomyces sulfonofaciens TaxID=68272 RepID=A0A919GQU1_9ACTN|nr:cation:proton antiporter [Streptomyces sulfonofaciens]GHH88664.1 potassium transporter [Streptomyces sulfonofaciens]